jgi:uncharacterized membrane protein (UPF0182 family)
MTIAGPKRVGPIHSVIVTLIIASILLISGLIVLGLISGFLVDWLWFSELGYAAVFWTMLGAKAAVFAVVFMGTAAAALLNGYLAHRWATSLPMQVPSDWTRAGVTTQQDLQDYLRQRLPWRTLIAAGAGLLGLAAAAVEVANWSVILRFIHQVPYGASDPVFGRDIGFYLFSLPAYLVLKNWMLATLFISAAVAGAIYWVHGHVEYAPGRRLASAVVIAHGSVLLGFFFLVKAWSYWLDRYLLLYGDNGVVVGASYTDVHVKLPVLWLLLALAVLAALLAWSNVRPRQLSRVVGAVVLVFGGSAALSGVVPALFQRLIVKPTELERERPFIESNIALTRRAYNLERIEARPFPAEQGLTLQTLEANKATVDNIRLWDWQPLMDTYAQMQEIRTYYKFHDVDVDRYWINGSYQQVMLSARELKSSLLPSNALTWVNRHLLFTHGAGVVMSPVTRTTAEGLPLFYLRDIPVVADGGPEVREPRIYYGEETDTYVVVKAGTPEFDYPKGKDNVYASYTGSGGIPIGSALRRSLFAWYFGDVNLLLSTYITGESRIMLRRDIRERVQTIVPFLRLDGDPYIVIDDGRLFWMQDAYTTSNYFPYAQASREFDLNYIRNSVKVVIDAYNGAAQLYLIDTTDPVAATWQRIFPALFKPFSAMPPGLQKHIRYPEDLFLIQARLFRTYHMQSADVFYNREDLWQFPREPSGRNAVMAPYYIIMRLPGESQAQFFVLLPMVPSRRDNMIAWLAARCDPPDYGTLIVYEFPKDKLVFGPFQIEARINQNTDISQQLSLWNQLGSRVIRGNLLVIPIENSVLYVSPLYLRAEQGQLPELKRVIAAYGDNVAMKDTLAEALAALFAESGAAPPRPRPGVGAAGSRAQEALEHYRQAMQRLKAGDWAGFGAQLDAMHAILEQMNPAR